jgi:hypothetical protein
MGTVQCHSLAPPGESVPFCVSRPRFWLCRAKSPRNHSPRVGGSSPSSGIRSRPPNPCCRAKGARNRWQGAGPTRTPTNALRADIHVPTVPVRAGVAVAARAGDRQVGDPQDLFAAALPPLRPAAFFCCVVPPWLLLLLLALPDPDFLPPRLDEPSELEIAAARLSSGHSVGRKPTIARTRIQSLGTTGPRSWRRPRRLCTRQIRTSNDDGPSNGWQRRFRRHVQVHELRERGPRPVDHESHALSQLSPRQVPARRQLQRPPSPRLLTPRS